MMNEKRETQLIMEKQDWRRHEKKRYERWWIKRRNKWKEGDENHGILGYIKMFVDVNDSGDCNYPSMTALYHKVAQVTDIWMIASERGGKSKLWMLIKGLF